MQLRINIPPLTRVLLVLIVVISLVFQVARFELGAAQGDPDFVALIPQWSLFYPWVYFTATFAEQNREANFCSIFNSFCNVSRVAVPENRVETQWKCQDGNANSIFHHSSYTSCWRRNSALGRQVP